MALLPILRYPDPRLHKIASDVTVFDAALQTQIDNMFETMYEAKGIGLAATQVDYHQRLVVIDVSESRNEPMVIINPKVLWASPERVKGEEGCLSVPGIYDGVERSTSIKISAQDAQGKTFEMAAEGLLAVCIQHEMDHLMGKVFVEYLSPFKQGRIKSKLVKQQRSEVD